LSSSLGFASTDISAITSPCLSPSKASIKLNLSVQEGTTNERLRERYNEIGVLRKEAIELNGLQIRAKWDLERKLKENRK
jgi:hypothetical protein